MTSGALPIVESSSWVGSSDLSFSAMCASFLVASPNDLTPGDHVVAAAFHRPIINTWQDAQLVCVDNSPMRMVTGVKRNQNAMASFARAIKRKPFRMRWSANQNCAFGGQLLRNFVGGVNDSDNPPKATGNPLPPRNSFYVGHVCSRKGTVTPSPSLPEDS